MFIQPNSVIKLYTGIPLDNKYEHTLYFSSKAKQNEYFHPTGTPKAKYVLTAQSYQRVVKGTMRIAKKAEDVYNCNYLAFQNSSFGNKWFYAFILSVEYVNNETCEISFEIDVMQSYWFDITLKECFVEREHAISDVIGANIEPEPLDIGEYVFEQYEAISDRNTNIPNLTDMLIIVCVSDISSGGAEGHLYDGIYGGTKYWAFNSTDVQDINNLLTNYLQAPDSIVSMYMCPKLLIPNVPEHGIALESTERAVSYQGTLPAISETSDFGVYHPHNNKLYTYPYTYAHIDNASGQSLCLRYEFFEPKNTPKFVINGTINQPVKLVLNPRAYKGSGKDPTGLGVVHPLHTETLTLENYPMCSWNTDSFSAWIAQNSIPIAINTVSSVASGGLRSSVSTANIRGHQNRRRANYIKEQTMPYTEGANILDTVSGLLSQAYTASIAADVVRGNISNGNVNVSSFFQTFWTARARITTQKARIIDDFFTRYGYATNRLKVPSVNGRPLWNYVKTNGCCVIGGAPSDDIRAIEMIFDNGITFWKDPNNVGDYSGDNSVQ